MIKINELQVGNWVEFMGQKNKSQGLLKRKIVLYCKAVTYPLNIKILSQ